MSRFYYAFQSCWLISLSFLLLGFYHSSDTTAIKNGESIAKKNNCVICHSTNGKLAPDLKDFISKYKNGKSLNKFLINPTMTGKYQGMMPPLKITDKEADHLLLYLQSVVNDKTMKKEQVIKKNK